jgi:peroxin-2
MNRQLVWETLTDFLFTVLPLLNLRKLRMRFSHAFWTSFLVRWIVQHLPAGARSALRLPSSRSGDKLQEGTSQGPLSHLSPTTCPICHSRTAAAAQGLSGMEPGDPTDPSTNLYSLGSSNSEDAQVKLPYQVDCCAGLYCYYCITAELCVWEEETAGLEGSWRCLRCGKEVSSISRAVLVTDMEKAASM